MISLYVYELLRYLTTSHLDSVGPLGIVGVGLVPCMAIVGLGCRHHKKRQTDGLGWNNPCKCAFIGGCDDLGDGGVAACSAILKDSHEGKAPCTIGSTACGVVLRYLVVFTGIAAFAWVSVPRLAGVILMKGAARLEPLEMDSDG